MLKKGKKRMMRKNQFDKRKKDNKMLRKKNKNGQKKTLSEDNKKEGTKDQCSGT
jgi:hypothetical protein